MLSRATTAALKRGLVNNYASRAFFGSHAPKEHGSKTDKIEFTFPKEIAGNKQLEEEYANLVSEQFRPVDLHRIDTYDASNTPSFVQYDILNDDPEFYTSKRLIGPFGTIEEPTMVYSPKPYRIVGCVGDYERSHGLVFMVLQGYMKHACRQCGQVFQLTDDPSEQITSYLPKKTEEEKMAHLIA